MLHLLRGVQSVNIRLYLKTAWYGSFQMEAFSDESIWEYLDDIPPSSLDQFLRLRERLVACEESLEHPTHTEIQSASEEGGSITPSRKDFKVLPAFATKPQLSTF